MRRRPLPSCERMLDSYPPRPTFFPYKAMGAPTKSRREALDVFSQHVWTMAPDLGSCKVTAQLQAAPRPSLTLDGDHAACFLVPGCVAVEAARPAMSLATEFGRCDMTMECSMQPERGSREALVRAWPRCWCCRSGVDWTWVWTSASGNFDESSAAPQAVAVPNPAPDSTALPPRSGREPGAHDGADQSQVMPRSWLPTPSARHRAEDDI